MSTVCNSDQTEDKSIISLFIQVFVFHAFFEKFSLETLQDFTIILQSQTSMISHENKLANDTDQEMKLREQITRLENDLIKAREKLKNTYKKSTARESLQKEIENDLTELYMQLTFKSKKIQQLKNDTTEL